MEKNIGKNTIGDNKKMSVDLKTYNMSKRMDKFGTVSSRAGLA